MSEEQKQPETEVKIEELKKTAREFGSSWIKRFTALNDCMISEISDLKVEPAGALSIYLSVHSAFFQSQVCRKISQMYKAEDRAIDMFESVLEDIKKIGIGDIKESMGEKKVFSEAVENIINELKSVDEKLKQQ